jgi:hypothetical protein
MSNRHAIAGVIGLTLGFGMAGCGGGKTVAASPFNDQGNKALSCMVHQANPPATADRPGPSEDPESVLTYLHYYTLNGNQAYCDGRPATATDRQWLSLYVAGGADRSKVKRALTGG